MPVFGTKSFVYNALPARVVFGAGTRKNIADELARLQRSRAFILSTPQQTADAESIRAQLGPQAVGMFSGATMHTPVDITERALQEVQASKADVLIAVGGGSTTGLGKAIALRTDLPQMVVPTTYAGSEMTPILGETTGSKKMTIRDLKVLPEVVIYDAELTYSLPAALSACRFQKLDSCVPVMQSAQDCMCDDVPEAVDRAPVRRILSERNMRTPPIIIGGEFRKDPPQVLFVEHDQMIGTLAPDRPDQALNMAVLPGRAE
jgi:alcohol dehydrogenase YqhD (iron-dependent ADH family)